MRAAPTVRLPPSVGVCKRAQKYLGILVCRGRSYLKVPLYVKKRYGEFYPVVLIHFSVYYFLRGGCFIIVVASL